MRIGLAADHGGFALKMQMTEALRTAGHEVIDFGARVLTLLASLGFGIMANLGLWI